VRNICLLALEALIDLEAPLGQELIVESRLVSIDIHSFVESLTPDTLLAAVQQNH
jgi:hypothetical protein